MLWGYNGINSLTKYRINESTLFKVTTLIDGNNKFSIIITKFFKLL